MSLDWQTQPNREMTFRDLDALRAEREAKKRELVDRLTKLLVQNFDFTELRFAWYCEGDAIRVEAYERARAGLSRR